MADFALTVKGKTLKVSPFRITGDHSEILNKKLGEARAKAAMPKDLPIEEGESAAAYEKRHKAWLKAQSKENSKKAFKDLILENKTLDLSGSTGFLYDCVVAIAETFEQDIDRSALSSIPLFQVNNFIFNVCKYARVPVEVAFIDPNIDDGSEMEID